MAPEMFRGDTKYGSGVDVYSFGIVMWELATRKTPWQDELKHLDDAEMFNVLNQALQQGRRPAIPGELRASVPIFVALMEWCWAPDPADRPTFTVAANRLTLCLRQVDSD